MSDTQDWQIARQAIVERADDYRQAILRRDETEAMYDAELERIGQLRAEAVDKLTVTVERLEAELTGWHQAAVQAGEARKTEDLVHVTLRHKVNSSVRIVAPDDTTTDDEINAVKAVEPALISETTKTTTRVDRNQIKDWIKDGRLNVTDEGEIVTPDGETLGLYVAETADTWKVDPK